MYKKRQAAKRFTLLLLEEEEDYVQDWVATCKWPAGVQGCPVGSAPLEGRVRLCTRSVFFDPDDVRVPIVRLPFKDTESLEASSGTGFTMRVTSVTKMKANMEEVPYVFEKGQVSAWTITLLYAPLNAILPMAQQLWASNKQIKARRNMELEAFVRAREDGVSFDMSRLADFSERIILDMPAIQLTPLVRERGHLVLSDTRLYFQPMHNVSGDSPVRSHPLAGVAAFARRRSCLRPLGLELFFVRPSDATAARQGVQGMGRVPSSSQGSMSDIQGSVDTHWGGQMWDAPSAFFAFRSESEREAVIQKLTACPHLGVSVVSAAPTPPTGTPSSLVHAHSLLLEAQGGWLHRVTAAWQAAKVSNFDYLLYLNLAAGRSFNDLAQWPVFPWVLCNWVAQTIDLNNPSVYRDLSKPIGAINPTRLAEFRRRFEEMPHDLVDESYIPPFMYGTHYSTPGYVMYWLLRAAPAHMLRLQNGRFDAPDRLFHSLRESWESVNNSTTDVKELIPEFYLPGGSWLLNLQRLPLGVRQNGQPVADVELPPWAKDVEHFLAVHRAALESPPVSRALHQWIDLVFGYKQKGPAAEEANNVFFHLTYEGAVDVSKVTDPIELKALETQINEFGQTPRQLFHLPHPPRRVVPPAPDPETVFKQLETADVGMAGGMAGSGGSVGASAGGLAASAVGAVSTTAAGGGVAASESGHRALALALISALSQAIAIQDDDASTRTESYAPSTAPSPSPALAARSEPSARSGFAATPSPSPRDAAGAAAPAGSEGALASAAGAAGAAAAAAASRVGGIFSGLLKLGRYHSGSGAALGAAGAAPSPPIPPTQQHDHLDTSHQHQHQHSPSPLSGMVSEPSPTTTHNPGQPEHTQPGLTSFASESSSMGMLHGAHEARMDQPTQVVAPGHEGEGHGAALGAVGGSNVNVGGVHIEAGGGTESQSDAGLGTSVLSFDLAANTPVHWTPGLPDRLYTCQDSAKTGTAPGTSQSICHTFRLSRGAVSGVAGWKHTAPLHESDNTGSLETCIATVSSNGQLKVASVSWPTPGPSHSTTATSQQQSQTPSHSVFRSQQLGGDLLCVTALHAPAVAAAGHAADGPASGPPHPLLLIGSHNQRVHVYDVGKGQLQGSFEAHQDAVCAVALPPAPITYHSSHPAWDHTPLVTPNRFFTSSWDCTVKCWRLSEGRHPWRRSLTGLAPSPEMTWDLGEGVWALAAGQEDTRLVVAGTEEGRVVACDMRSDTPAWAVNVSTQDYIGGVSLLPDGRYLACCVGDGSLALLDMRHTGSRLALAYTDAPLRCCTSDGTYLLAGSEAGNVHIWDVTLGRADAPATGSAGMGAGAGAYPGPDGLYEPWTPPIVAESAAAVDANGSGVDEDGVSVTALSVWPWFESDGRCGTQVVVGREDGSVVSVLTRE